MKIILGSQSIGRKKVLEDAGYTFEILPADIDEKAIRNEDFEKLPLLIAKAKTEKLIPLVKDAILITSDQVVVCNGELREKPYSENEARRYLESYREFPAQTNTSVVVTNTNTGLQATGIDISKTYFKSMPDEVIQAAIRTGKAMNTAGAFLMEDELFKPFIERIEGDTTGVLGLPLRLTEELMQKVQ